MESEIIDFRAQHIKVLINDDLQTALKLYGNAFPSQGCETMPRSPAKKKKKKKRKKLPVGVWQVHMRAPLLAARVRHLPGPSSKAFISINNTL